MILRDGKKTMPGEPRKKTNLSFHYNHWLFNIGIRISWLKVYEIIRINNWVVFFHALKT